MSSPNQQLSSNIITTSPYRHHNRNNQHRDSSKTFSMIVFFVASAAIASLTIVSSSNKDNDNKQPLSPSSSMLQKLLMELGIRRNKMTQCNNNLHSLLNRIMKFSLFTWSSSVSSSSSSSSSSSKLSLNTKTLTIDKVKENDDILFDDNDIKIANNDTTATTTICNNIKNIQCIINHWFHSYPPNEARKKLWMISHSSVTLRDTVDDYINTNFAALICELMKERIHSNNDNNKDGDDDDNDHNGNNNNNNSLRLVDDWCNHIEIYGWAGKVAAIVALDQYSRHIHRHRQRCFHSSHTNNNNDHDSSNNSSSNNNSIDYFPPQDKLDAMAKRISNQFLLQHINEIKCGGIPLPCHIFALMPYRHPPVTIKATEIVRDNIDNIMTVLYEQDMTCLISRFRSATNRRLAVLQDEGRRRGGGVGSGDDKNSGGDGEQAIENVKDDATVEINDDANSNKDTDTTIVQQQQLQHHELKQQQLFTDDDILEAHPFDADESDLLNHPVSRAVISFLADRGIHSSVSSSTTTSSGAVEVSKGRRRGKTDRKWKSYNNNNSGDHCSITAKHNTASNNNNNAISNHHTNINNQQTCQPPQLPRPVTPQKQQPIILSLSGGIDSNVLLHILTRLRNTTHPNLNIVPVHVDYANRPESSAEAQFVVTYATSHRIQCEKCFVRRIDEVTRGKTSRNIYEQVSRNVRWELYTSVIEKCRQTLLSTDDNDDDGNVKENITEIGVVLGHHRGDLRENVLSNANKGCGPLDLSGMTSVSTNNGVVLYRPLLTLDKDDIYNYANKYGVPYFRDTTPSWSTRGKVRNKLLPLLSDIYGEGCFTNLSSLAIKSDEARTMMMGIIRPFLNLATVRPLGLTFDTRYPFRNAGMYFWSLALREVLHSAGRGMWTEGSVLSFLKRIGAADDNADSGIKEVVDESNMTTTNNSHVIKRPGWLQSHRDYAVRLEHDGRVHVLDPIAFPWRNDQRFNDVVGTGELKCMLRVLVYFCFITGVNVYLRV